MTVPSSLNRPFHDYPHAESKILGEDMPDKVRCVPRGGDRRAVPGIVHAVRNG